MATVRPGFHPVKTLSGAAWNGQVSRYVIPAAEGVAVFFGDLVKASDSAAQDGIPACEALAAASDVMLGVVVGIERVKSTGTVENGSSPNLDTPNYRPASTSSVYYALVVDDPNVIFQAPCSATIAQASIGLNAQPTVGAGGSTVTGNSTHAVDASTVATTNTHGLRIVGFVNSPDNNPAGTAGDAVLVKINRHAYANQIAGV